MAVDVLQEKIRKKKNPTMLLLACGPRELPPDFKPEDSPARRYLSYYGGLLDTLRDLVPAVRVSFSSFALLGPQGLEALSLLLSQARGMGYYVALDAPQMLSAQAAAQTADLFLSEGCPYEFDGLILPSYLGSDIFKPFLPGCKKQGKDFFMVARTSNRSASELQDLLTGFRLVHSAAADLVNRFAGDCIGKHGFSQLGIVAGASSADSLKMLRSTYPQLFLLMDGSDYPNANARNCSNAFDRFGHGAVACIGSSVTEAWQKGEDQEPMAAARAAAERMRKNMLRYVNIL